MHITRAEDLPGQAAAKGACLLARLTELRERYPDVLAAARGKGLLLGLAFMDEQIGGKVAASMLRRGVLVAGSCSNARVIRLEPAPGIPWALLEQVVDRLEDTFSEVRGQADSACSRPPGTNGMERFDRVASSVWSHDSSTPW